MYLFILRIAILCVGGVFGYLKISKDVTGALYGLSIGAGLVIVEMLLEKIHLYKKKKRVLVLDASALIDGRIADLCENYFFAENLVVLSYVIKYLKSLSKEKNWKFRQEKTGLL